MTTAMGLDANPAEMGVPARDEACSPGSKRWVALFVALAAGWGALFGYSAMVLTEDMPFRPISAAPSESPVFGFPPIALPPITLPPIALPPIAVPDGGRVAARRLDDTGPASLALPVAPASTGPAPAASPLASIPSPSIAPVPASPPTPRPERAEYVGTWGPHEAACGARSRRRGYIPATITPERAQAGRTVCAFHDGHRTGNAWVMAAECSERGRRWSSQVRLVVDGDRLTWTSGKGSSSYVRCNRRAG